jgi:hypothetical protein
MYWNTLRFYILVVWGNIFVRKLNYIHLKIFYYFLPFDRWGAAAPVPANGTVGRQLLSLLSPFRLDLIFLSIFQRLAYACGTGICLQMDLAR